MIKSYKVLLLCLLTVLLFFSPENNKAQDPSSPHFPIDLHPQVTKLLNGEIDVPSNNSQAGKKTHGVKMVSFLNLPGHFISDVWAHGDYAYVGGWGPNTTVRVVDISIPSSPSVVATIPGMGPFTSPQDIKAGKISTPYFQGDLLVVGNDGFRGGIELYDIRNPESPVLLGSYAEPFVHNTFLYQKKNRAFVLLAIPTREVGFYCCPWIVSSPGEFLVIEITDPANPTLVGEWAAGTDGGFGAGFPWFPVPPGSECTHCRGNSPVVVLHDVWANEQGTVAYLSYWDLGLILLDISDPSNPSLISQTTEPPTFGSDEGNCHIAVPAKGGNLTLVGDEDFSPGPMGFLRIFDTSDPSNPVQVGAFATSGTLENTETNPWSSMHNLMVRGNRAYIAWYNEGMRVIDFTIPSNPIEIGAFHAPAGTTNPSLLWGVYVHKSHILVSDISGGLFILKMEAGANQLAIEDGHTNQFSKLDNYPNPFTWETTIRFRLAESSRISLKVYDHSGRVVRKLAEGVYEAGEQVIRWDGKDEAGNDLPAGVYISRLENGKTMQLKKFVLIR